MTNNTQTVADRATFTSDPSHSQVGFSVRHMGFSRVRGRFSDYEVTIEMEPGNIDSISTEASIDVASIDTRAEQRDEHLRSDDFFDAENHPQITFRSTDVKNVDGDRFTLVGDLTMRGVTRQVELDAEFLGSGTDPWGGNRVAFEARTQVNRKDFGLNWNQVLETGGMLVSEKVEIVLEIQAAEQSED